MITHVLKIWFIGCNVKQHFTRLTTQLSRNQTQIEARIRQTQRQLKRAHEQQHKAEEGTNGYAKIE